VSDGLKLTVYFAERDRAGGAFLADALAGVYERHELRASVLLRGVMGIGARHALQSELSLTLSESLPAVSVAVDRRERIERALPEVMALAEHGLVTLERARVLAAEQLRDDVRAPAEDLGEAVKLTAYGGRGSGRLHAVGALQRAGLAGATVLAAVDGTLHGERRRARFLGRDAGVPLMVLAVGAPAALGGVLPALAGMLDDPVVTLERVQICRTHGRPARPPRQVAERDAEGRPIWQQLTVHSEGQTRHDGRPLHVQLIRRLRQEGAAGATVLRGELGFFGDQRPSGDRLLSVRRHAPVTTVIIDTPAAVRSLWPMIEELTAEAGLVTCELVPAFHAPGSHAR
jgi:PII-like signaling protein